jgi:hypothetical protein
MQQVSLHRFLAFVAILCGVMWTHQSQANAPTGQYVVSNGTVLDTQSQLTWERNPSDVLVSFDAANAYCAGLTLDGGNWRVPSMKELQTIIDETRIDPCIDISAFPNTFLDKYWSSTLWVGGTPDAWYVRFDYGSSNIDPTVNLHYVRCVR